MRESIDIDSVFLAFGTVKILRGVNIHLAQNSITGLLGRNGSGKSCFLKIITGSLIPQSKHIKYKGKKIDNLYTIKGLINYLPQHECHPKSLTLGKLVHFYDVEANFLIQSYPVFSKNMDRKFSDLSGGERRIVEVLLVLESKTKFTILDEPFSHIMPKDIGMIKKRIMELKSKKGIVLTDHQYRNILELSDDLYFMKDGSLKSIASEQDLKKHGYIR